MESFLGNFLFSICMLFGVALHLGAGRRRDHGGDARPWWRCCRGLILRERIAPRVAAGIACAVAGIALVSLAQDAERRRAGLRWSGNLLLLGAVICEASYVVIGKQLTGNVSPKRISALINLWGLALVTPFGALAGAELRLRQRRRRSLVAAGLLLDRRQHGHRVAVDDRAEARAGRRRPACSP